MRFLPLSLVYLALAALAAAQMTLSRSAPRPGDPPIDGPAVVYSWPAPTSVPASLGPNEKVKVRLRFVVDTNGVVTTARVTESTNSAFNASALETIRTWKFRPALDNGVAVVMCMDGAMVYSASTADLYKAAAPPVEPRPSKRTEAEPLEEPEGDYPDIMTDRKLYGKAIFACTIDPSGHVINPVILGATHVEFVPAALDALAKWRFTPATQGDLKVATPLRGAVTFDAITEHRQEILAANNITGPDGEPPAAAPKILAAADPVFPYDRLISGDSGEASVEFTVTANGQISNLKVKSASEPEYGEALLAALASWQFEPGTHDEQGVDVALLQTYTFKGVPKEATEADPDPLAAIVAEDRAKKITSASGLDEKLTPIYRVAPVYPPALYATTKEKGQAMLSLVICQDGRVRLAHALSASAPEFGWAAITAANQWVFKPPLRRGKPVDVAVQLPVNFPAPK